MGKNRTISYQSYFVVRTKDIVFSYLALEVVLVALPTWGALHIATMNFDRVGPSQGSSRNVHGSIKETAEGTEAARKEEMEKITEVEVAGTVVVEEELVEVVAVIEIVVDLVARDWSNGNDSAEYSEPCSERGYENGQQVNGDTDGNIDAGSENNSSNSENEEDDDDVVVSNTDVS